MLALKRVYEPASPGDGGRILTDRLWPRGLSKEKAKVDVWAKEAAPSNDLRKWFGHDPEKWVEFKKRYAAELKANPEGVSELRDSIKGHAKVTLVYGARDEEHNEAVVLRDFLSAKVGK